MVGVARIELATPAMSRQGHQRFFAEIGGFSMFSFANDSRTNAESRAGLPRFYRGGSVTDSELIEFAASFREGVLDGGPSKSMCAAVSLPLASLLRMSGVQCETVESDLTEELGLLYANHLWIKLADGRALDPTADQFNPWGFDYPPVYLGAPTELHRPPCPTPPGSRT